MSPRDPDILGGRPGRPSKDPKPLALTAAEEDEFSKARSGKLEWVGPGVAAYVLGISKDALKKRRQRNEGLIPEYRPVKSNRQGAQYRWSSVERCGGAERMTRSTLPLVQAVEPYAGAECIPPNVLAQRLDDVVALLKKLGVEGLKKDLAWAYNDADRLVGFASLHPQLPARALTLLEALDAPWVSSEARQPFHDWAMGVLHSAAESAAKAAD
ncbi:hypothetical protein GIW57_03400 [Stenotrophomonas sp. PA-6-5C]|jgi:hypothetical protein|uniref:hypothetical protein n=1 Tax=Stenotrophomonas sp. PA-6-5C TaxID=2665487 RepID=UPI001F29A6B1|nr:MULTISPECIES: hypothetical protein [Stenotrophomonas]MCF5089219.1 hypothetical protein [Stenotrophomonas sp. PA-6-5C]HDX0955642.1 hypothetical protein [Stenotrophomonas maltophilia]